MLQYSGYPPTVEHHRELVIGSLPSSPDRRILEDCRVKSQCFCNLCPACQGRNAYIQGQRILQAASTIPDRRLRFGTFTAADVPLDELRESIAQIMRSTKATLKALNLAHYAASTEFSVVKWEDRFHPHSHIIASTPPGKGFIKAHDWTNEWLSNLPSYLHPASRGEHPYWANTLLSRHIRPAALDAGINKTIGWHTFRRTFATLLQSSGATVKTTQELMRHSTPVMTLGTYAQAVTADKREAQDRIAAMILPHPVEEMGTLVA